MKNFFGKVLNLLGIIGIAAITVFSIVLFSMGFIVEHLDICDFTDMKENTSALYNVVPLIFFILSTLLIIALFIITIYHLINNRNGKIPFIVSLVTLIVLIIGLSLSIVLRMNLCSEENLMLNIKCLSIVEGLKIFFVGMLFMGSVLTFKSVK